jgi:hypothetical protein
LEKPTKVASLTVVNSVNERKNPKIKGITKAIRNAKRVGKTKMKK